MKDFLLEIFAHPWNILLYKTKISYIFIPTFVFREFPMLSITYIRNPYRIQNDLSSQIWKMIHGIL